jgi:ribosomal protein L12E/L44/L45/RPP1/RPP2
MVEALDEPAEKAAEVAIPAAAAATAAVGATEDEETPSDVAEEEPKVTEEEILEDLDAAGEGEEE